MAKILVEVSARHAHLSQKDLEALFGNGYKLKIKKQLSQPSEFAAEETVSIKNLKFRIIGPAREKTQVELSKTDAIFLGIDAPVRLSGDVANSPGVVLIGPAGEAQIKEGVIIAERHIHCNKTEAKKLGLKNKVSVEINSERPVVFKNIKVRVQDDFKLCLHLDTDEGNACGINKTGEGKIL